MTNYNFQNPIRLEICKDGKSYNMRSLWIHYYAKHHRFAKGYLSNLTRLVRDFGEVFEPSDLEKIEEALEILDAELLKAIKTKYEAHKAFLIRQGVRLNWDSET